MCVARPAARYLFSRCLASATPKTRFPSASRPTCHPFHSSAHLSGRRRSRFRSVRAAEMGLVTPDAVEKFTEENFPRYTPEEKEILGQHYTKEQMEALEAGEAAIDPKDLTIQGRLRTDQYRMGYLDDFSTIMPVIDKRQKTKLPPDTEGKFMSPDEFGEDFAKWGLGLGGKDSMEDIDLEKLDLGEASGGDKLTITQVMEAIKRSAPAGESGQDDVEELKWWLDRPSVTGTGETGNTALAPALPHKVPGVAGLYKRETDAEDEGLDEAGIYQDLKKQTGMKVRDILDVSTKVLVVRFVHNQTRLGKVRSSSVMVIAGNGNGRLGVGVAKSTEHQTAVLKAKLAAIRNMQPIVRYENRTIYGTVTAKVSGTVVQLSTRPPGFGLRVPHRIFEMCRAAGISDLAARIPRSRNPMNTVKATFQALMNQPNPEEIAIGRGKKLVDVRKVYFGGAVY